MWKYKFGKADENELALFGFIYRDVKGFEKLKLKIAYKF